MSARLASRVVLAALALAACRESKPTQVFPEELVVAVIEGTEVTRGQFESYLRYGVHLPDEPPTSSEEKGGGDEDFTDEVRSRLFDRYVREQILVARARDEGIEVDEADIDSFAQAMGLGPLAQFQEGMPLTQREYLRRYIEESLLVKRFLSTTVLAGLEVSDADLRANYDAHLDRYRLPERFRLRLIRVDNMKAARDLSSRVGQSRDKFVAEAAALSEDDDEQGHDLGLWSAAQLPEAFAAVVPQLLPGQLSEVIEDPDGGFNLILLEERVPPTVISFDAVAKRLHRDLLGERRELAITEATQLARDTLDVELRVANLGFTYYPPASPSKDGPTAGAAETTTANGGA